MFFRFFLTAFRHQSQMARLFCATITRRGLVQGHKVHNRTSLKKLKYNKKNIEPLETFFKYDLGNIASLKYFENIIESKN